MGTGQNCKIDSGSDLILWVKHFSEFIIYTVAPVSQNPPPSGGNSGGGGGNAALEWNNPPKAPVEGFDISINNGEKYTASPTVILSLTGGLDTSRMMIYNSSYLKDAVQENYAANKIWNLCWKNSSLQSPSNCPTGTYAVYVKYYAPWGTASNIASDTIILKVLDVPVVNLNQPSTKKIKLGQTSANIKQLQIFPNQNPDTQIAKSDVGSPGKETASFGFLTKAAMIKFQEKFASEFLTPLGLKKVTGICAEYTRAKINKMLGF